MQSRVIGPMWPRLEVGSELRIARRTTSDTFPSDVVGE
jgi:hypothetical protein